MRRDRRPLRRLGAGAADRRAREHPALRGEGRARLREGARVGARSPRDRARGGVMTTIEPLKAARALIAEPEHWTTVLPARNGHGYGTEVLGSDTVAWCA